jgi:hypothetical protein
MKKIMSCLAVAALAVFTSAAFAQDPAPAPQAAPPQEVQAEEPVLTSAVVKFDTTTNNKDQKTGLDVYLKNSHGHEVGKSEGNEGRWERNSTHTLTLVVERDATKEQVANGSVTLTIHPQHRDDWAFNYKVTFKFSDGTFITKEFNGCDLNQHDPARTDSFKG